MDDVATELRSDSARYQEIAFRVFAVVGFLSSIVTIGSWLSSTQASLAALVTPTSVEMPADIELSGAESVRYDLASAIDDLTDRYCNPVGADFDGSKQKNYFYSAEKCETSKALFSSITKITELSGKKLSAWDVELKNDGQDVAENIILRTSVPASVRISDSDGNPVGIEASSSDRVFSLPNLNPKEGYKIKVISSTPIPASYENNFEAPKVTFSGGVATQRENITVSGRYSGIVGFLDEMPTILQIVFVLFGALFITMIWVLPLSMLSDANEKRKGPKGGDSAETN